MPDASPAKKPPDLRKYGIYNRPNYRPRRTLRGSMVLLLLFCALVGFFMYGRGKVVKINDGDSFVLLSGRNNFERVRLYGVDCPELNQPGGREARQFSSNLLFLQEVQLTPLSIDPYSRVVALVQLPDGRLLNEELVRHGLAWVYPRYCREAWCDSWAKLEKEARDAGRGLWAAENPTPPWQWRQNK